MVKNKLWILSLQFEKIYVFYCDTQLWSGQLKDLKSPEGFMETEVIKELSHLTLDVIGESAFSYKFNSVLGGDSKISEAFNTVIQGFEFKYLILKLMIPFFDYLPLKENRRIQSAREISDNIVMEVHSLVKRITNNDMWIELMKGGHFRRCLSSK